MTGQQLVEKMAGTLAVSAEEPSISTRSMQVGRSTCEGWKAPLWLGDWQASYDVPVSLERVCADIASVEAALIPAEERMIGALMTKLVDALNPPPMNASHESASAKLRAWWERNRQIYVAALADLPNDLMIKACDATIRECRFMPKPADIRQHVSEALSARVVARSRLRYARTKATARDKARLAVSDLSALTAEQMAARDEIMARIGANSTPRQPKADQAA